MPICELTIAKTSIRKKDAKQIARIANSIKTFGQVYPVLLNKVGAIVDGHLVVEAARDLGLEKVYCVRLEHLDEDEARLLSIALNRIQECGEWDVEGLAFELAELELLDLDLTVTGFEIPELDAIIGPQEITDQADNAPEVQEHSVSCLGDVWLCGPHRVVCGNSLEAASYEHALAGTKAAAIIGDWPYNLKIEGVVSGLGKTKHKDFVMAAGEMSQSEFEQFLTASLKHCLTNCQNGGVIYAFMDWRNIHLVRIAADKVGLHHLNTVVWDKGAGGMGALYRSAHEFIGVLGTAKTPVINNVKLGKYGRDRTNVQHYPGANKQGSSASKALKLHATPKPVELIGDLMLDVTNPGDLVLDPFLGSGTALIAGEVQNRIVAGIELDPRFVDVSVRRWEEWTGETAIHEETVKTMIELVELRAKD
ncbi:hypothetical protein AAW01_11235 [Aurantiacibacter gangjinensis]|uniref:Methyltransferase n=2 Tax=Aurantiacibacter gangjinensis TaxID=502682 RepID=A0A0G9MNY3_9SPHN|nr:hypothetical protein AAW01_11235 [Aurantiacibacter gangjinensis]